MRIIEPSFEIMFKETLHNFTKKLERIARTCYKSEDKISEDTDLRLIKTLLGRKHYPMFDHVTVSVRVICDRGVAHEIVRHRIAAYAQESTRFCNYSKDKFGGHITFIKPCFFPEIICGIADPKYLSIDKPPKTKAAMWTHQMYWCEKTYLKMIEEGCKPEEARSVLPNSLKTEIVMTLDLTAWRHFFTLRTAKAAHPQMREITVPLLEKFKTLIPLIFDDIGGNNE